MIASRRWIVLAPAALAILAAVTGCKMGQKGHTSRETKCCSQSAAAEDPFHDGKGSSCVSSKTSCGAVEIHGCTTSCGTQHGCTTAREGKCSCNTKTEVKCQTNTDSAAVQLGKMVPQSEATPPQQPIQTLDAPEEKNTRKLPKLDETGPPPPPSPISLKPATDVDGAVLTRVIPSAETAAPPTTKNPFLRVSQTQEWAEPVAVPAAHVPRKVYRQTGNRSGVNGRQLQRAQGYSKAWSDALGLSFNGEAPASMVRP